MLSTATFAATREATTGADILIVDDDDDVAESLGFVLVGEGYTVRRVADAREAIEYLTTSASLPDLILLDLMMPLMSGWEFRVLQRKQPAWTDIPVIAMSANRSAQAAAIDADAYLQKPIDMGALLSTVDGLLAAERQKHRETHHAELERLSALGILAAGVAHEINNPLAFVVGNLELAQKHTRALESQLTGEDQARVIAIGQLLKRIDGGAQRIADIVRSVSAYSRPDTLSEGPIDVVEVLEGSIQLVENELRHHAKLARHYDDTPQARGNAAKLGQVFLNLLTNATRAVSDEICTVPEIRVTTAMAPDGGAEVTVADNGAGIPPALLSRIFDPFFSTRPHGGGMGLGLAISQRIVASMGGTLTVHSVLGEGSTFRVRLPPSNEAKLEKRPPSPPSVLDHARAPKVLIIDDEPMMCDLLATVLGDAYEVHVRTTAREALRGLLEGESYDAILCDLMMPELSGMELYAQLGRARPDQAARVVFMTGGTFTQRAQAFLEGLHGGHLAKPFRPPEVIALVESRIAAQGLVHSTARHTN